MRNCLLYNAVVKEKRGIAREWLWGVGLILAILALRFGFPDAYVDFRNQFAPWVRYILG